MATKRTQLNPIRLDSLWVSLKFYSEESKIDQLLSKVVQTQAIQASNAVHFL